MSATAAAPLGILLVNTGTPAAPRAAEVAPVKTERKAPPPPVVSAPSKQAKGRKKAAKRG